MEGSHAIDGVDVYSDATFTAINCLFNNFDTPLICNSQSTVKLTNCSFIDNKVALKVGLYFKTARHAMLDIAYMGLTLF